jgi:hypothetical protein
MVVARGHVIALTEPNGARLRGAPDAPSTFLQMVAFSRAMDANGMESGLLEYMTPIANGGVTVAGWQVVDGGMYYLAGEKLHLLRGAGANAAANR